MEIAAKDWVCSNCGQRGGEMEALGTVRAYRCYRCEEVFIQQVGTVALAPLPDLEALIADLLELRSDLAQPS